MADKLRVATASLCGCFGCHMSFLDIDERIVKLVENIEFDRSPINDIKSCSRYDDHHHTLLKVKKKFFQMLSRHEKERGGGDT